MTTTNEVTRYRAELANLLEESVATTREHERWLNVTGGLREAMARFDLASYPTTTLRIMCALLLRKARLHAAAVPRANDLLRHGPPAPNPPHRRKIHSHLKRHGVLRHHFPAECAHVHVGVK